MSSILVHPDFGVAAANSTMTNPGRGGARASVLYVNLTTGKQEPLIQVFYPGERQGAPPGYRALNRKERRAILAVNRRTKP